MVRMLGEAGIIPQEDAQKIVEGLKGILADVEAGKIEFSQEAEDIHMNVETILIERIGDAGKRLHTGRSRNDQVALDGRIYVKEAIFHHRDEFVKAELGNVLFPWDTNTVHPVLRGIFAAGTAEKVRAQTLRRKQENDRTRCVPTTFLCFQ